MGERGSSLGLLVVTSATPWGCGTRMPSQREWESEVEKDSWRSGFCPPCSWESLDGYKEFSKALNDYRVMIWVWWILSKNIWESHYLCLVNPCRDRLIALFITSSNCVFAGPPSKSWSLSLFLESGLACDSLWTEERVRSDSVSIPSSGPCPGRAPG